MTRFKTFGAVALLLLAGSGARGAHAQRAPRPLPRGSAHPDLSVSHRSADPRTPELRRELALEPLARHAVWIDLDPHAAATSLPPALSRAAIERRARRGIGILPNDRPIARGLVKRLVQAGARIRVLDRWDRSVSADVDSVAAARIARLAFVTRMEPVRRLLVLGTPARAGGLAVPTSAQPADSVYGLLYPALQQLNIPAAHALGLTGTGVRIGILDSGFDRNHEALRPMNVMRQYDFIWGDTIVGDQPADTFKQAPHGTGTASILGANKPGSMLGAAYGATFLLAKTDVMNLVLDSHQDEDRWVAGALWMDSLGVDIISSSLGYGQGEPFPDGTYNCSVMDGRTTRTSRAASALARRGVLLVTAMGNQGEHTDPTTNSNACTLDAPADADSIVAVGAVDATGHVASWSSRGPTRDGRVKPELSALGISVPIALAYTLSGYGSDGGTSYATPLIAGAAALVLQAWPTLTPLGVRQALEFAAPNPAPDNAVGYGVPDVASAIMFPQGLIISLPPQPSDAFKFIRSVAPKFIWNAASVSLKVQRPIMYHVEVAADSAFKSMLYSDNVADAFELTSRVPLRPTLTLWWRVTATANAPGGGVIQRRTMASGSFSIPRWVTILNLNDPAHPYVGTATPTFKWSALAAPPPVGPLLFRVEVFNKDNVLVASDTTRADSLKLHQPLDYNVPFTWRVIAQARDTIGRIVADTVSASGNFVVSSDVAPPSTTLYQNFPNPFPRNDVDATSTRITFDLRTKGPVELAIYDLHGRLVRRLIPAPGCPQQILGPGLFGRSAEGNALAPCGLTSWDGTDDTGRQMPKGVYLLRLRADGTSQTRHIVYTPLR